MAAVLLKLGYHTLVDWRSILIAAIAVAIVFGYKKISSMWIVIGGAILYPLLTFIPL